MLGRVERSLFSVEQILKDKSSRHESVGSACAVVFVVNSASPPEDNDSPRLHPKNSYYCTMTASRDALVDRLRIVLAAEPSLREVSMFGGTSIMVNEKMVVSALKDGGLLVRVAADRHEELLGRPGARQAEMGAGRQMGPGWIEVAPDAIADRKASLTG